LGAQCSTTGRGIHQEVYAIKPLLEHITAGMQYVLGDLQADDRPSVPGAK
jgi:hypothetical protein